jgi:hypothetical protein
MDAVQTHCGKDWVAISVLVPGRTQKQCWNRWHGTLHCSTDRAHITGLWVEDEDIKLKDAVQMHGDNDWVAIAALVPGRTNNQCHKRWHGALNPSIGWANRRKGIWTADEDIKLKDAVQTHGGKNWGAISALVPDRTEIQCRDRWKKHMVPGRTQMQCRDG